MHRTALTCQLAWYSVWETELGTPITSANWNHGHFRSDDGTTDGACNFLTALPSETNMTSTVANGNECFESSTLTGTGLLLHRHHFHHLVLESIFAEKMVNDLVLLDSHRKQVDFLQILDLALLYKASELGNRNPFSFISKTPTPTATSASTSTSTTASASASTSTPTSTESSTKSSTATKSSTTTTTVS